MKKRETSDICVLSSAVKELREDMDRLEGVVKTLYVLMFAMVLILFLFLVMR